MLTATHNNNISPL